jgi:hypothetical protein
LSLDGKAVTANKQSEQHCMILPIIAYLTKTDSYQGERRKNSSKTKKGKTVKLDSFDRRSFIKGSLLMGTAVSTGVILSACSPQIAEDTSKEESDAPANEALGSGATTADTMASGDYPWLGVEPVIADADVETEIEADVIVIGCGLAGTAAARSASEEGATVIVFEKASGPQCRSGDYAIINGDLMEKWGHGGFDPELLAEHELDEMSYMPKPAIWNKWANNCAEVFNWYIGAKEDLFICESSRSDVPDDKTGAFLSPYYTPLPERYDWTKETHPLFPCSCAFSPSQEPVLLANMDKAVSGGDVTPYYGHFVEKLVMDAQRCAGCYARNAETGKYVKATARKGIVLATGDYGSNPEIYDYYNPELKKDGIGGMWMNMDVEGNPTNTGDGMKLGAWIGAGIQEHHAPMIHWMGCVPGPEAAFATPAGIPMGAMGGAPFLQLNKAGKRFMNEDIPGVQVQNQVVVQKDHWSFQIWDSAWKDQLQFFPPRHGSPCYYDDTVPKNHDTLEYMNDAKLEAAVEAGICIKANTLEELIANWDIDKDVALASIERYNKMAKAGKDEDYGKIASRLFALESPPYYGAEGGAAGWLVILGGLESDENCHVYTRGRDIIDSLYVAGNIQGNRFNVQYPIALKGVSHSMALYYGYVAGKNAVKGV